MNDVRDAQFVAKASDGTPGAPPAFAACRHLSLAGNHVRVDPEPGHRRGSVGRLAAAGVVAGGGGVRARAVRAGAGVPAQSRWGCWCWSGWTAALFYHLFAGLRHLAWDMG